MLKFHQPTANFLIQTTLLTVISKQKKNINVKLFVTVKHKNCLHFTNSSKSTRHTAANQIGITKVTKLHDYMIKTYFVENLHKTSRYKGILFIAKHLGIVQLMKGLQLPKTNKPTYKNIV